MALAWNKLSPEEYKKALAYADKSKVMESPNGSIRPLRALDAESTLAPLH